MKLSEAETLSAGDMIHHKTITNADGTPMRFKVTSVKTWKTRPGEIRIGIKRGLYEYFHLNQYDLDPYDLGSE